MASIILECPHCGAEKIGFELVSQIADPRNSQVGSVVFRVPMQCAGCHELVIGVFRSTGASRGPNDVGSDPRDRGWALLGTYPTPMPSRCPEHTPDALKRVFSQAANAHKRGDPDASGAMSRKVVDNSTQLLLGEESKKYGTIYARIEALKDRNMLTADLAAWAHEVRLGGNDAAHDLEPYTQDESDELLGFAELYLIYVYSLPERLKLRRAKAAAEKAKRSGGDSN